jgi:hypothetical protein
LTSTWATLTSGGGGIAAPPGAAWLLQPLVMTTTAMLAARPTAVGRKVDLEKTGREFIRVYLMVFQYGSVVPGVAADRCSVMRRRRCGYSFLAQRPGLSIHRRSTAARIDSGRYRVRLHRLAQWSKGTGSRSIELESGNDRPDIGPIPDRSRSMARDLNDTLIFVRVVEHGSFIAAARALRLPITKDARKVHDLYDRLRAQHQHRT